MNGVAVAPSRNYVRGCAAAGLVLATAALLVYRATLLPGLDFGDTADFRRGIDLFVEMVRRRYSRGRPSSPTMARNTFAVRAMLYRLGANVNVAAIAEEEVRAAGWDRSDYAPR